MKQDTDKAVRGMRSIHQKEGSGRLSRLSIPSPSKIQVPGIKLDVNQERRESPSLYRLSMNGRDSIHISSPKTLTRYTNLELSQ